MRRLWPMIGKGRPARVTPVDSKSSPATTWAWYQIDGADGGRWGSLQSMGRPVAVIVPSITQLLLAAPAVPGGVQRAASRNSSMASPPCAAAGRPVSVRVGGVAAGEGEASVLVVPGAGRPGGS